MSDENDDPFNMQSVQSSNIAALGYDPKTETMRVTFVKNGNTYELDNVPQAQFEFLKNSQSIGSTYAQFFKGAYDTRPV